METSCDLRSCNLLDRLHASDAIAQSRSRLVAMEKRFVNSGAALAPKTET